MGCEYCNKINDYKGKYIYKDNLHQVFIVLNVLKILNFVEKSTVGIEIKYCPMCGERIK